MAAQRLLHSSISTLTPPTPQPSGGRRRQEGQGTRFPCPQERPRAGTAPGLGAHCPLGWLSWRRLRADDCPSLSPLRATLGPRDTSNGLLSDYRPTWPVPRSLLAGCPRPGLWALPPTLRHAHLGVRVHALGESPGAQNKQSLLQSCRNVACGPTRWLGPGPSQPRPLPHTGTSGSQGRQPGLRLVSGCFRVRGPRGQLPHPCPQFGQATPLTAPARPWASCLFADSSLLSAGNTHRKSGREGPIPILIYTGRCIKSRPSLPGRSLPALTAARRAEREAPGGRPGGRPREVPRGGRTGLGSTSGPRRQRWWPRSSLGLGNIRYGRGDVGGGQGVGPADHGSCRLACTRVTSELQPPPPFFPIGAIPNAWRALGPLGRGRPLLGGPV